MLSLGLFVLCVASLLPSSLGYSNRPSWSTVVWDVAPEDLERQSISTGSQCSYLPYLLDKLWSYPDLLDATFGSVEMLYRSSPALCLLSGVFLVGICIWRKARRCQREVSDGDQAGQTVADCWDCQALGFRSAMGRTRSNSPCDHEGFSRTLKCPASSTDPFPPLGGIGGSHLQKRKWGQADPGGRKIWSLPEAFFAHRAAWSSPAGPKFLKKRLSPAVYVPSPPKAHVPFVMPPLASCFQEMSKTSSASSGTCCHSGYSYDSYEVLCRMEENIILMQKHLRELLLQHPKAGRIQRAKKKRKVEGRHGRGGEHFTCLDSHSSQEALGGNRGGIAAQ